MTTTTTPKGTNNNSDELQKYLKMSVPISITSSTTTTVTIPHDEAEEEEEELLPSQHDILEDPTRSVASSVSITMIASTLLLRIPILSIADNDDERDENNNNNNSDITQQLTAWLDHYHEQQQQQQRSLLLSHNNNNNNNNNNNIDRNAITAAKVASSGDNYPNIHLTSKECYNDFQYLHQCRQHIHIILQHISDHYCTYQTIHNISYPDDDIDIATSHNNSDRNNIFISHQQQQQSNHVPFIEYAVEELQNYVAVLQEFIHQGFPANEYDGYGYVSFTWYCPIKYDEEEDDQPDDTGDEHENEHDDYRESLQEKKSLRFYETHSSLSWECANVIYNIVVLYTYRSSAILDYHHHHHHPMTTTTNASVSVPVPTRAQWTKAGQYLQNAATMVRYLRQTYYVPPVPITTTTCFTSHAENGRGDEITSLSNHTDSNHSNKTSNTLTAMNSNIIWCNSVLLCNAKFLEVLQLHLLAEAQRAAYQTFVVTNMTSSSSSSSNVPPSTNKATTTSSSITTTTIATTTTPPPKHFVLAKLAAAAVPLYLAVENLCQGNNNEYDNDDDDPTDEYDDNDNHVVDISVREELYIGDNSSHSGLPTSTGSATSTSMTPFIPPQQSPVQQQQWSNTQFIQEWEDSVRAYGMWMTTLAEYHQSWVHRKRNSSTATTSSSFDGSYNGNPTITTTECGMEIARLEGALKFADYCRDFCESTNVPSVQLLLPQILQLVREMEVRFDIAKSEFDQNYQGTTIPDHDELPEIQQVLSVKTDIENISKLLPALNPERVTLFADVLDPKLRCYVDMFRMKAHKVIVQTEQLANRQTEQAREQLAVVNLPHSITTYRQQQIGGGLPDDIWNRIVPLQEQQVVEQFLRKVWSIRKQSDTANDIIEQIHAQLIDVLEIDTVFRQTNSQFVGHDVQQIHKIFHPILQTYDQVLSSARTSDDLLMKRCDTFDTDPKFRLLKLQKSDLNRLFPPLTAQEQDDDDGNIFDTDEIRNLLVELSNLISHRETIIHSLHEHCKTYDISKELMNCGANSYNTYEEIVDMALTSLQPLVNDIRTNLEKQGKLLFKIKSENERFMKVRDHEAYRRLASKVSMQGGPIVKIYDALEEVESFQRHIEQGEDFYGVVIPKLQKLHEQVKDVSGRLAKERMEYEKLPRRAQRSSFTRDNDVGQSTGGYNGNSSRFETNGMVGQQSSRPHGSPNPPRNVVDRMLPQQPRAARQTETMSQSDAGVYVDDEKVASLVGMDFDTVKVVAALKRHNNDLELALNELLAG